MATKPHRTSRIARLARIAIAVAGTALATASWASITSSENPSTDGSYTVSWSWVPNAHAYQLYEDDTLVYDSTGTSWSFSGKAAGDYEYTVGFCEFIFDEEMCYESVYTALTVTVSSAPAPTVSASFDESSITRGEDVTLSWSSTNASACSGSPAISSTATSGTKTYTPTSAGSFSVTVTCTGDGGSADDSASVTVKRQATGTVRGRWVPPPPGVLGCVHIHTSESAVSATMTIRLAPDLKDRLERLAEATRRSKSFLAAEAIRDFVDLNEWQVGEIQKAVAEADQEDFASAERVDEVFGKWGVRAG